jgi:hypothetical protein
MTRAAVLALAMLATALWLYVAQLRHAVDEAAARANECRPMLTDCATVASRAVEVADRCIEDLNRYRELVTSTATAVGGQ